MIFKNDIQFFFNISKCFKISIYGDNDLIMRYNTQMFLHFYNTCNGFGYISTTFNIKTYEFTKNILI